VCVRVRICACARQTGHMKSHRRTRGENHLCLLCQLGGRGVEQELQRRLGRHSGGPGPAKLGTFLKGTQETGCRFSRRLS
jgi:hypothetical protein